MEEETDGSECERDGSKKTVVLMELVCPRRVARSVGVGVVRACKRVV